MIDHLSRPEPEDDLECLVEPIGHDGLVGDLPEPSELSPGVDPETHPEGEPALGQVIQGDRLPGHLVGASPGERGDGRPQADAAGDRGHGGQRDPGVGDVLDIIGRSPHVVPQEEAVPTRLFGGHGQLHHRLGPGELAERGQEEGVAHGNRLGTDRPIVIVRTPSPSAMMRS